MNKKSDTGARPRPTLKQVRAAAAFSTATLHEAAGRIGALPPEIKPVAPQFTLGGPVVTVRSPRGDNLWLHRALAMMQPGDVMLVDVGGGHEFGYWGEIMSVAARAKKLGGLIIDGCVRDVRQLEKVGFPIFARGLCIRGTGKDAAGKGAINRPLRLGDCEVNPGDLAVGDRDGVVVLPRTRIPEIVRAARQREAKEAGIMRRLWAGENTLEIYGWS